MRSQRSAALRDGVAYIAPNGVEWIEALSAPESIVLAPTEHILMLAVDLPLSTQRQRAAALPFAVEGYLAEPLSQVHVVLGLEIAPRRHVAAVVQHAVMADWVDKITSAGLERARLVPDALILPVPAAGAWSVSANGDRVLVRTAEGAGFVVARETLPAAWKAAGRPTLLSHGEDLPAGMPATDAGAPVALAPDASRFDLRQGTYAVASRRSLASLRTVGSVVVAGALAYGALVTVDLVVLQRLAAQRRAEAQTLLQEMAPALPVSGDPATDLARLTPRGGAGHRGRFLSLFSDTATALKPFASAVAMQSLTYSDTDGTLSFNLETPDLGTLQRIEAALTAAKLQATSGAATAGRGGAEARIVVRGGMAVR